MAHNLPTERVPQDPGQDPTINSRQDVCKTLYSHVWLSVLLSCQNRLTVEYLGAFYVILSRYIEQDGTFPLAARLWMMRNIYLVTVFHSFASLMLLSEVLHIGVKSFSWLNYAFLVKMNFAQGKTQRYKINKYAFKTTREKRTMRVGLVYNQRLL